MTAAILYPVLDVKSTTSQPNPHAHDPHVLPDFNAESSSAPKLYLPPLLSSLPEQYPPLEVKPESPPIVTETRLPDIDPASLSLHKALHHFRPMTQDYASVPYANAFNWSELELPIEDEREWYCVVFRSKRMPGRDDICRYFGILSQPVY
ncbi:hypothetical protein CPC08DRAFT_84460 [Agrocybe pediades]|nr:hypothetical protein CPC08DRAFT_84460 [Agrocybe pediades]